MKGTTSRPRAISTQVNACVSAGTVRKLRTPRTRWIRHVVSPTLLRFAPATRARLKPELKEKLQRWLQRHWCSWWMPRAASWWRGTFDKAFVPASVTKIVTAWLAAEVFGRDYRFPDTLLSRRQAGALCARRRRSFSDLRGAGAARD